jgi:YVTN family beta-propeller protein
MVLVIAPAAAGAADTAAMQVLQRWQLGGEGGWDYLIADPLKERLFISRGTRVDVLDIQSGKIVGSIAETAGVHGIALAPGLNRGYTSNGRANSVTAFALDSLKVLQEMKVPGSNPDAILYEPAGKHVFTFNGASKDVTVLDGATLAVAATIPVPDKPEFAVEDGRGEIFVNIESDPGRDRRQETGHQGRLAASGLQQSYRPGHRWSTSPPVFSLRRQGHGRDRRLERQTGGAGSDRRASGCRGLR